jgi:hypothetical protein
VAVTGALQMSEFATGLSAPALSGNVKRNLPPTWPMALEASERPVGPVPDD